MTVRRDDMVFRPTLSRSIDTSAQTRARRDIRLDREKRRGGVLGRLAKAKAAKRVLAARRARKAARRVRVARAGASGLRAAGGLAARSASRAAVANPIGLIVAAAVVVGIVATRLGTGRPLEGVGADINEVLLGDMDEEARAKMHTRRQLAGDSDVARVVGHEGRINSQIRSVGQDIARLEFQRERGKALIEREFPVNSLLDMLIVRAADAIKRSFSGSGGHDAINRLREGFSNPSWRSARSPK